ncbi:tellurite resistance TerB family protein [Defluviimonas sp. WL0024]|uniref:Tellurite resistance TerB family protein n=2 Tax=Albidovulum TaxID=205889 RepID=A0ABT3J398_9RHOB|nr:MULTISPECIES: tellurite resistance TerB family protein [Defluviimonas]MCU9848785.1 tellurite resistance TerB family protein [Defluviimonas sp. WL0024]MCW3782149.1 tellurite resistance TerB family protein [Defluviimonas salinarum]
MSFVKTLAALAAGFAAAKGYDKYQDMGGMAGVKKMMKEAGEPGGMVDQLGASAEKMGLPGGARAVRELYEQFGGATDAAEAGLGGLLASMTGAATAGSKAMGEMMGAMVGASPASAIAEEHARLMIRAMIQAAKADGEIDAEEQRKILDHLGDASAEEVAFVRAELQRPSDVMALAQATDESMRAQIYATSLMAIRVDNPAEHIYLSQLAQALRLDPTTRARLHREMGLAEG